MKKRLALVVVAVIYIACFAGCSEKNKTIQKSGEDANDTVVTVWISDGAGQPTWEELADNWNSTIGDEKDIYIDWVTIKDAQQYDVAQQSGQLPEIVGLSTARIKKFQALGDIIAIEDLPGGKEFLEEYDMPGVEGNNVFDGKQYTVQRKATTAGLVYNKDLFKKAGIVDKNGEAKAPETISELKEAAKKITALGGGVYGFAFPLKFGTYYTVEMQTGNSFNIDNPSIKVDLDNLTVSYQGYKDMFSWLLDLKKDGSLFPGAETLDNDTARAYFSAGIIGMIPAVSWDVEVYTEQFPAECDWDVCAFPVLDGFEFTQNTASIAGGMSISKNALKDEKTAKATMEAYKFIYSIETRKALYEEGIEISCKRDVLEVADEKKIDPRLMKFALFVPEGLKSYPTESYVLEGENWQTLFQRVWMGDISLDAAIKDIETRATAGLRKAVSQGAYDVARQKEIDAEKRADFEARKLAK